MMTSGATRLPGSGVVTVEEMHYGKLVVARGGHVPPGEGFATTYLTKGVSNPEKLLPTRLLDGTPLQPDRIDEPFRASGALVFRLVDHAFVAMRARYRPESGEGKPGRNYLQACLIQVAAPQGWANVPPSFLPWVEQEIGSEPDLVGTPRSHRIGVAPRVLDFGLPEPVTMHRLAAIDPMRQRRLQTIVHAIRSPAALTVIGDDLFDDPAIRLGDFLTDVEMALTLTGQAREPISRNFQVVCGLSPQAIRHGLLLTSSAGSTVQSSVGWDDIMRFVQPRAAAQPQSGNRGGRHFGQQSRTSQSESGHRQAGEVLRTGTPGRSGPASLSSNPGRHDDGVGSRRVADLGSVASDSSHLEALTAFREAFNRAESLTYAALNTDRTMGEAILDLFDLASDSWHRQALGRWNPFCEQDVPPSDLLLALLLGLQGRDELLDRFTLGEILKLKSQWDAASVYRGRKSAAWLARFIEKIDDRIGRLRYLTDAERKMLGDDPDIVALPEMQTPAANDTAWHVIAFCEILDRTENNFNHISDQELEIVKSYMGRFTKRYQASMAGTNSDLAFCTLPKFLQDNSIFRLAPRNKMQQHSKLEMQDISKKLDKLCYSLFSI